ncbi:hypothetical protein F9L33_11435 [Amylibacter sp. SFDW26]|uniref:protein-disulfide reductase DsbD domain-containing protein n=1 Tax=Amylibacter sp. SFDW26 TaxID=2652722 RepID=UPI0012623361|nr:protein-disulfide reductase DsbD domain-containing protein [Amylibacter sp. SFDW26]KAB7613960.1 hypothetical protein F9L33_11435 [Amylibacter sp. SFDW26]
MLKQILKISCLIAAVTNPAAAEDYSAQTGIKAIEFLQGWRKKNGKHMAAIRIRLEDGWKTYWRAPGGNGIPPAFKWNGSNNIKGVQYHWPTPEVFNQDGIQTLGYENELVLPIEFTPSQNGAPIKIKTHIDFGVCADVCIPVNSRLNAELIAGTVAYYDEIETALSKRPKSAKAGGVRSISCKVDPTADGLSITANIKFKGQAPKAQRAVIEFPDKNIWINSTSLAQSGKTATAQAELISFSNNPFILDRSKLRVTLIGASKSIEIVGCPAAS